MGALAVRLVTRLDLETTRVTFDLPRRIAQPSGDLMHGAFYADSSLTIFKRLLRRENIFKAHKLHLYQILANEFGLAHWKVSSLYFVIQLALGTASLYLLMYRQDLIVPLFVVFTFSAALAYLIVMFIAAKQGESKALKSQIPTSKSQ